TGMGLRCVMEVNNRALCVHLLGCRIFVASRSAHIKYTEGALSGRHRLTFFRGANKPINSSPALEGMSDVKTVTDALGEAKPGAESDSIRGSHPACLCRRVEI